MTIIAIWLGLCLAVGYIASQKGRSGLGYFLLSLLMSPLIGIVVVALVPNQQGVAPAPGPTGDGWVRK